MADEVGKKIGNRDDRGPLSDRGYVSSSTPPHFADSGPDRPPSPRTKALAQRHRLHRLIDRGLSQFPDRLAVAEWRQIQAELQTFDPGLRGLIVHLNDLVLLTRRVAMENGDSDGPSNLTAAAAFHTWANDVVDALEQYRRDCEALHAAGSAE